MYTNSGKNIKNIFNVLDSIHIDQDIAHLGLPW